MPHLMDSTLTALSGAAAQPRAVKDKAIAEENWVKLGSHAFSQLGAGMLEYNCLHFLFPALVLSIT